MSGGVVFRAVIPKVSEVTPGGPHLKRRWTPPVVIEPSRSLSHIDKSLFAPSDTHIPPTPLLGPLS